MNPEPFLARERLGCLGVPGLPSLHQHPGLCLILEDGESLETFLGPGERFHHIVTEGAQ